MASTQLSIPQRYRAGAEAIALLSPSEAEAIQRVLDKGEVSISGPASSEVLSPLTHISTAKLNRILQTLKSLYSERGRSKKSVEIFVRDLVRDIKRRKPDLFSSSDGWALAANNFEVLLRIDALELIQRERLTRSADDKKFCRAEVLVELRPVFTGEAGDELRRLLVAYRLKLGFHGQGDKHEDIYISLDIDDIQALRESLSQAEFQGDLLENQAKKMLAVGGH